MRVFKSHPLLQLLNSYVIDSSQPSNLSFAWNFGSLLATCLVIQIVTGVTLAMHFNPSVSEAFNSVEHIMRDVNNGWLIRYFHSNTASAFFFIVYLHIGRGLYYGSYQRPRTLTWYIGTVIFITMMARKKWPNWILVNLIYKSTVRHLSLLSFVQARTRAILRIGPHNKDILSIIVCGYIFTLKKRYLSTTRIVNAKRLTKLERAKFNLTPNLRDALIGLLLGDVSAVKRSVKGNTYLYFEQGFIHKQYLFHLYNLFSNYCGAAPKITDRLPDKRTGKIYTRIVFVTYCLPCFNEIYAYFYSPITGKKRVALNIAELLTPIGLAYWICDDGTYNKRDKLIRIATNSYTLQEVNLLLDVLREKFNLRCRAIKDFSGYVITIYPESTVHLQQLLEPVMPGMMKYKLGL